MAQKCGEICEAEEKGDMVMKRTVKSMEEKYLLPSLELVPGGLEGIHGTVEYSDHGSLHSAE